MVIRSQKVDQQSNEEWNGQFSWFMWS